MKTRSTLALLAIATLATAFSSPVMLAPVVAEPAATVAATAPHRILFGTFKSADKAEAHAKLLREKHRVHLIAVVEFRGEWAVITSYDFPTKARAEAWLAGRKIGGAKLVASGDLPAGPSTLREEGASTQLYMRQNVGSASQGSRKAMIESRRSAAVKPGEAVAADAIAPFAATASTPSNMPASAAAPLYSRADAFATGSTGSMPDFREAEAASSERYQALDDNRFHTPDAQPLSTFSIDVDTASYANVRRHLSNGQVPPADAVRTEELVNYFDYDYPEPKGDDPFSISTEVGQCPWNVEHRLVRIGLKARDVSTENRPPANLVFLLDVSGSMNSPNKLPLLKESLSLLVDQLDARDTVTIAVYAGSSGLALPPTPGNFGEEIKTAMDMLQAGGSTNGAAGIQLAYDAARENFVDGGINRVFLCTDGDFNVGVSNDGGLVRLVEEQSKSGVFLSVLGFGMGNYNDAMLEQITNKGNGNYAYIDTIEEARRTLVANAAGTMMTVARDVKVQVEFNPTRVASYRLVGYENRLLAAEDFNDDKKDAGEIGAGHTVTALYEIVPAGLKSDVIPVAVDPLKYQKREGDAASEELLTVKLRHKPLDGDESRLQSVAVQDRVAKLEVCSDDFIWAATVANFAMTLRESKQRGLADVGMMIDLAEAAKSTDADGSREEFLQLMRNYRELQPE